MTRPRAAPVVLIRDGTIIGPHGTEIDFRTPDYSVWLTMTLAVALEAAFSKETDRG